MGCKALTNIRGKNKVASQEIECQIDSEKSLNVVGFKDSLSIMQEKKAKL